MARSIPSIPQFFRNVRRTTEILSILSKYGLADWLSRTNIEFVKDRLQSPDGECIARTSKSARIRLALTELGPTFIKVGQLLSTRADLVGVELADELAKLQANTPEDSFEKIREVVESELEMSLEDAFAHFERRPIASASIGQVHRARTLDGNEVVVKVRHPGIERVIETDMDILMELAKLAERLEDFRQYQPTAVVKELARTLKRELDFSREHRNLMQFRSLFRKQKRLVIPKPYPKLSTEKVLTMTCLDGVKLNDLKNSTEEFDDLEDFARRGAKIYLDMIFVHGFYHADPHPGNIVIMDGNVIGLLDFGMVGRISERTREDIEGMLMAIVNHDVPLLVMFVERIGNCPVDLDTSGLSTDIADFVGQYATQQANDFDMARALRDFMSIVRRYRVTLPSEVSLLIKVLVTLEGTGQLLAPNFSLLEIMRPHQRLMMVRRMSPTRQIRKARTFYMQLEQLAERMPQRLGNILEQIQSGKFDVHLDHRRLGPSVNRLVLGMITSALFLGSSLMLSYKVPPVWFPERGPLGFQDLSVLGILGCFASLMIGARLLWAIRSSGNLDQ
ncbi:MAG: AarF/ABC1/UbiB kinase family protein [Pirellulaceae bacterium]|nr:AarF/ABC1/UbiB kinase family protein [Pirellulaceae bacterium]